MKVFVLMNVSSKSDMKDVLEDISSVVPIKTHFESYSVYDLMISLDGRAEELREYVRKLRRVQGIMSTLTLNCTESYYV